jgi:S1-C subfamily serine protease
MGEYRRGLSKRFRCSGPLSLLSALSHLLLVLLLTSLLLLSHSEFAVADPGIATRTSEEQRTIDVYKRANLAVVFITTKTYVVDPFDIFDSVRPQEGTGTGTVIDERRGLVLTNLHVIRSVLEAGGSVEIMLANGQNARAKLVGYDQESDLALFKLVQPPTDLVGLEFGDSSKLEVGQRVLAIGNPFGLNKSLTAGIISSLDRTMKTPEGAVLKGLIQTDAAINPGNSGGPLLDADGRLIGINTAILSQSGDSAGIGFAVPINVVKRIVPDLVSTGKVLRPQLGWRLADTDQGPMVSVVSPGSAAERAGLQPIHRPVSGVFVQGYRRDIDSADLIVKVNGKRVQNKDEVEELVSRADPGQPITMTVRRGGLYGKERTVNVVPELR